MLWNYRGLSPILMQLLYATDSPDGVRVTAYDFLARGKFTQEQSLALSLTLGLGSSTSPRS